MKSIVKKGMCLLLSMLIIVSALSITSEVHVNANYEPFNNDFSMNISGKKAYDYYDNRYVFNGENVLSVEDKASLLTNIYKNNQKFTILEILPFEVASIYKMNSLPRELENYFKELFEKDSSFVDYVSHSQDKSLIPNDKKFANEYTSNCRVKLYLDKGSDCLFDLTYENGNWRNSANKNNGKIYNWYIDWENKLVVDNVTYNTYYMEESFFIGHGKGGEYFSDPWHDYELTFTNDNGVRKFKAAKATNCLMDQLLGELDETSIYYRYRDYFEDNVEVISVCASDFKKTDLYRDDPVDIIYIGGPVQQANQININMSFVYGTDYNCLTDVASSSTYDKIHTGVYERVKDGEGNYTDEYKEYTFNDLSTKKVWFDSYSKDGASYKVNDISWDMLEEIIKYIYGDCVSYNANSTVTHLDTGVTEYQNIPVFMEAGECSKHMDFNISKLEFLLEKMTNEMGTMDGLNIIRYYDNGTEYISGHSNGFVTYGDEGFGTTLLNKTSYKADDSSKDSFFKLNDNYTGFMKYYFDSDYGTTSAGIPTKTVSGKTIWEESGKSVFIPLDKIIPSPNGRFSVTNTTMKYYEGVTYYSYTDAEYATTVNWMKEYNGNNLESATYTKRDIDAISNDDKTDFSFTAAGLFKYMIGLDISDFMKAPDAYFENDPGRYSFDVVKSKNMFVVYYSEDTNILAMLDEYNNLNIYYSIDDRNDRVVAACLYATDNTDYNAELYVETFMNPNMLKKFEGYETYDTYDKTMSQILSWDGITPYDEEGHVIQILDAYTMYYNSKDDVFTDLKDVTQHANKVDDSVIKQITAGMGNHKRITDAEGIIHGVYNFSCQIPFSSDTESLYYGLINGTKSLHFTAMNYLYFMKTTLKGEQNRSQYLSDTAQLRFVARKIFDLD